MTEKYMEKFDRLNQEHYEALKPYYRHYTSEIHDLNLTNLLIWRKKHDLHTLELGGYLWIVYNPTNPFEVKFSEPIGDYTDTDALKKSTDQWLEFCEEMKLAPRLRHIGDFYRDFLTAEGYSFEPVPIEDAFDYCYLSENLASLSGNKYHKKKNHLNQFQKNYNDRYRIEPIDASNANIAFMAARDWCIANGCGESLDLCYEFQSIQEVLTSWSEQQKRGLEGIVIFVDEHPVALTFGEFIGNDTFLVHIEKADQTVQGIYTAVNHALANQVSGRCHIINREQDMGVEGLRKAKLSYHPHHMVNKFDALIKMDV